jgi:hypothetical protein
MQHPQAEVFPVVLVTEPSLAEVPSRLDATVGGIPVLTFQVRVSRIGAADLPRLRSLQNRVAAVLIALTIQDAVEAAVAAISAMVHAPGPVDDVRRFLPLAVKLAKMKEADEPRLRHRMTEEPDMNNMLDEIKVASRAEGKAEGKVETLRDLVAKGLVTVDVARAEIQHMVSQGVISGQMGREAIQLLG